jgi:hypothetical protein
MLKAAALTRAGNPVLIVGLSKGNLAALLERGPIVFKVGELAGGPALPAGHPLAGRGLDDLEVCIFAGEDEEQMAAELERRGLAPKGSAAAARHAIATGETQVTRQEPQ